MPHFEEKGTLPIGFEFDGKTCRDFRIRPLKAEKAKEFRESEDFKLCDGNDWLMGLAFIGLRLRIEGVPREKQNLTFLREIYDDDLNELVAADRRLQKKIAEFRGDAKKADSAGTAASEHPVEEGKQPGGGSGEGPGVAERMECHTGPINGCALEDDPNSPWP